MKNIFVDKTEAFNTLLNDNYQIQQFLWLSVFDLIFETGADKIRMVKKIAIKIKKNTIYGI